ncbi:MAG: helix-turn-helix domain-containing protein [Candidatus Nealsonbacteria bacterium]|nr:helix-turn-helix domain-containing protein [Candidatus Nealsonbacteria bacterium]
MARLIDREKSLALRKQGMSYSQIKKILKVSKSTLSLWLRKYPLSKQRIRELRDWNEQRIERCRETKRSKKEERLKSYYREQRKIIFPINKRELYLAGLFLYWGEGSKYKIAELSVSNSDPSVIRFFIRWLVVALKIPKIKMKIQLQLYNDMNIDKELQFWSKIIEIPISQFNKPYIKKTSINRINHKGGFGHGTCQARIGDARLSEKILMAIKTISDQYNKLRP